MYNAIVEGCNNNADKVPLILDNSNDAALDRAAGSVTGRRGNTCKLVQMDACPYLIPLEEWRQQTGR